MTPLCCWNGAPVFFKFYDNETKPWLHRYRNGKIETLDLAPYRIEISGAVALNDGGLLVYGWRGCGLVRCTSDGRMEIVRVYAAFSKFRSPPTDVVPWSNGVFYRDDLGTGKVVFCALPSQGMHFTRLEKCQNTIAIFSDEKHACAVSRGRKELREWDTQGRERVFLTQKGSAVERSNFVRANGTCRGRAFLTVLENTGYASAFIYTGNGRFEDGPPGHGQWAAYDDRAYRLRDGTLTCYEARETPEPLRDLCARRAAAIECSDGQLATLPLELRELLSSLHATKAVS